MPQLERMRKEAKCVLQIMLHMPQEIQISKLARAPRKLARKHLHMPGGTLVIDDY